MTSVPARRVSRVRAPRCEHQARVNCEKLFFNCVSQALLGFTIMFATGDCVHGLINEFDGIGFHRPSFFSGGVFVIEAADRLLKALSVPKGSVTLKTKFAGV